MDLLPIHPVAIGVLGIGTLVAALLVLYGVRELQLASHVLRSRPDSVLDATGGGPIELRGTVDPADGILRAPISRTACVAYEYEVEERQNSGKNSSWNTIDSGEESIPFYLDDGSGGVLVESRGATFRLEVDDRLRVDGGTEPPEPIRRFIERSEAVDDQNRTLDLRVVELRTGSDRRFVERRLDVGAEAHVLGTARYDTTVSRAAGQVNAVVGVNEAAYAPSRWARLRHRLFGYPFIISDRNERTLGLLATAYGMGALLAAVTAVILPLAWLV